MKNKKKSFCRNHKILCVLVGLLVISIILLAFSFSELKAFNAKHFEFDQKTASSKQIGRDAYITISRSKEWYSDGAVGAQFDCVLTNASKYYFTDWHAKLEVPSNSRIDSSWNGQYTLEGRTIDVIPPLEYNKVVPAGKNITFGLVLYTPEPYDMNVVSFSGHFKRNHKEDPFVISCIWLTVIIGTIIILYAIVMISLTIRMRIERRGYIERQEHDNLLIDQTMKSFSNFIDAKDSYTRGHAVRVASFSRAIAKQLGFSKEAIRNIYYTGLMHDIGKISIPDNVLNKAGRLTMEEWAIIKAHTTKGYEMLKDFTVLPDLKDAVLHHHEKYDGTGYPDKLKGDNIPIESRIICVADSYDAMSTDRCYRPRLSNEKIISELTENSGKQFDPQIVKIMLSFIQSGKINSLSKV